MRKMVYPIAGISFILLWAGVMRDDVSEEKYINLAKEKQFNCVGKVYHQDKFAGSCVLIGQRYVLSAAHVFLNYSFRQDTMMIGNQKVVANVATGATVAPATEYSFSFGGKSYRGKKNIVVNGFYNFKKGQDDLILFELEEKVTDVQPAKLNGTFDELGSEITGVGFGASGFAGQPQTVIKSEKKIAGQNVIDSLGGMLVNGQKAKLFCDFDSPAHPEWNRIGSAKPRTLEYIGSGGDSGGGMFRSKNGVWELVGIYHGNEAGMETLMTRGYYGLLMEWTRVSVYQDWIKQNTTNETR